MRAPPLALAVLACKYDDKVAVESGVAEPSLGMRLDRDGVTCAGAAAIDMTPVFFETHTDLNGHFTRSGCVEDDFVGLGSPRIHAARDRLAVDEFDPDRFLASWAAPYGR